MHLAKPSLAWCLTCLREGAALLVTALLMACSGSREPAPANAAGSGQESGGAGGTEEPPTGGAGGSAGDPPGAGGGGGSLDASRIDAMRDVVVSDTALTGPGHVTIDRDGSNFILRRDGVPYYIRGFVGQTRLELAHQYGGNSTRIYTSRGAGQTLETVRLRGITLLLGIELSKVPADYTNEMYKTTKRTEVTNLLANYKDHPALLMWALGNEINLGADVQAAWAFVDELAGMIRQQDPHHPVMTVLAGSSRAVINNVALWAPQINVLGVNGYGGITNADVDVKGSNFTGPYVVTEFGPTGHWEVANTTWLRPFEQTSAQKAIVYQNRYEYIFQHRDRALGSYVFLWGQKQERTPTWYGMFLERQTALGLNQETCPTIDAMAFKWSGAWPANRAPEVTALTLNGLLMTASVTLTAGQVVPAQVTAADPESDPLRFVWELLPEPTMLGTGGSAEVRPTRVTSAMTTTPTTTITAPATPGQYRLFVYVLDGQGHAGTANLPFLVN
jgi:hypothetical protein